MQTEQGCFNFKTNFLFPGGSRGSAGDTSNNKVQGYPCLTFGYDPKIWMAKNLEPKNMGPNFNCSSTELALS